MMKPQVFRKWQSLAAAVTAEGGVRFLYPHASYPHLGAVRVGFVAMPDSELTCRGTSSITQTPPKPDRQRRREASGLGQVIGQ